MSNLKFADAVRIARGCTDYGGGYVGDAESHAIYQHGIQTVINALEGAEERGLKDTQTRALHQLGERGQFNLIVQRPKFGAPVNGVLSIDRNGEAMFFAGTGGSSRDLYAVLQRSRIEFAAATGIRLSGFEPHGFDRAGNQKYQYQEWWLAYTKDERREGVDLARALLYDNDQLKTDINERHEL